jgi:hypothetical protein
MTIYATNADRPVAGLQYIPDSMEARGSPLPIAPFPGITNGTGDEVKAGDWGLDWTFTTLNRVEMDWWANLVTYGYPPATPGFPRNSHRFSYNGEGLALPAARVWGLDGRMIDFVTAVIYIPTWQKYQNGYFHDCIVRFRRMVVMVP